MLTMPTVGEEIEVQWQSNRTLRWYRGRVTAERGAHSGKRCWSSASRMSHCERSDPGVLAGTGVRAGHSNSLRGVRIGTQGDEDEQME